MITERAPGLLDALMGAVSARVSKRVVDNPELARGWVWTQGDAGLEVRADDVIVRVAGPIATEETLTCTCLMAPRCLHRLAVVAALPDAGGAAELAEEVASAAQAGSRVALDEGQAAVVAQAEAALADLLALGAHRADAIVRATLTRVAWEARAVGLHRLGRALTGVVQSLRLYAAGHPTFSLAALSAGLSESALLVRQLPADATPDRVGQARRSYETVGALRLYGLVSEAVLVAGVAGVVTWMVDARGRLFEVPDVRPRPAGQAIGVYDVAPPLSTLAHRALCREGLFIQDATAAEGRLGAGQAVQAVRAGGSAWASSPVADLWARGAVGGLRFVTGAVAGLAHDGLVLQTADGPVSVVPGSEHASLPWRENLRLLSRAPGLEVRLIGREVAGRPRVVVGLGLAGEALTLPTSWSGRVCLGLDRLTTAHVPVVSQRETWVGLVVGHEADPFVVLRRRVDRVALGGLGSLPGEARGQVEAEAGRLVTAAAPTAAAVLLGLADSAVAARQSAPSSFLWAWLTATSFLDAADRGRARRAW